MHGGKTAGKAGVLHAHLNGYCLTLRQREPQHLTQRIAQGKAEEVVKHHNKDYQPAPTISFSALAAMTMATIAAMASEEKAGR